MHVLHTLTLTLKSKNKNNFPLWQKMVSNGGKTSNTESLLVNEKPLPDPQHDTADNASFA